MCTWRVCVRVRAWEGKTGQEPEYALCLCVCVRARARASVKIEIEIDVDIDIEVDIDPGIAADGCNERLKDRGARSPWRCKRKLESTGTDMLPESRISRG